MYLSKIIMLLTAIYIKEWDVKIWDIDQQYVYNSWEQTIVKEKDILIFYLA